MTVGELRRWLATFPDDWAVTGEGLAIHHVTHRPTDDGEQRVDLTRRLIEHREDIPRGC